MASRKRRHARLVDLGVTRLEELALRIGVDEEGRAAIACLQQPNALFRDAPALHHHVIQLFAQKLVHHAFVLAAHLNEVRQRANRRHGGTERSRLEQAPHRVGGVAMIANEGIQRVAPPFYGCLFAAQLVGMGAPCMFDGPLRLQSLAQRPDLRLQTLYVCVCRLKAQAATVRSPRQDVPIRCAPGRSRLPAARLRAPAPPGSLRPARYSCARCRRA